jgi:flavin reductase (DIM6/NTAB) family NADH-FMN oxidoreductase RutF/pimeloyl-ACP methyl ester carboxylesterase
MTITTFNGFGGVTLQAEVVGDGNDPAILLIHGIGQSRAVWNDVSDALVRAGRRVIALDLRGHGGSGAPGEGRFDFDAHVGDLRAVLAQVGTRPVVVAAMQAGWIATQALADDATSLAAALVLVDMPTRFEGEAFGGPVLADLASQIEAVAPKLALPTLFVRGALSPHDSSGDAEQFARALPDCEMVEVGEVDRLLATDQTDDFNGLLVDFLERKQPRGPSEFRAGSDARTLRDALGCFATGITVVTAMSPDGTPIGLTANSFTSVSLDPPLLLVCIANTASSGPILQQAEHFAVNVLQIGQQPVSNRFAGKGEDRFAASDWSEGENGAPVLAGSLSAFECRRHAVHEGGDHFILVGEVKRAQFDARRDPLLYFRGKYRRLHFA